MGRLSSLLIGVISGASAAYYLSTEQGKKVTKKVVRFVKDYQEDPQEVYHSFKDKLQKENLSGNDLVQSIRKQTESEDIVLELDEKDSEEAAEEDIKEA